MNRTITRVVDGVLYAYAPEPGDTGPLEPAAAFPLPADAEVHGHAAADDLGLAVHATAFAVTCVDRAGVTRWQYGLLPRTAVKHGHRADCAFAADGSAVWVYRPDAMAKRGPDAWIVLDAATGALLARAELAGCVGHGASHFRHPDGSFLLDVGEGQDGVRVFRGRLEQGELALTAYPWTGRSPIALSPPDGSRFLTVAHDQSEVAFHAYPGGEILAALPVEALPHPHEEPFFAWNGGYLDESTAIVTYSGETPHGTEWHLHHRVDARDARPLGPLDAPTADPYELVLPGDGSWLTGARHPVRHLPPSDAHEQTPLPGF